MCMRSNCWALDGRASRAVCVQRDRSSHERTMWPPGLHTTDREPKYAHLRAPGASKHHPNSTRRPPKKGKKERKLWREREKTRNLEPYRGAFQLNIAPAAGGRPKFPRNCWERGGGGESSQCLVTRSGFGKKSTKKNGRKTCTEKGNKTAPAQMKVHVQPCAIQGSIKMVSRNDRFWLAVRMNARCARIFLESETEVGSEILCLDCGLFHRDIDSGQVRGTIFGGRSGLIWEHQGPLCF